MLNFAIRQFSIKIWTEAYVAERGSWDPDNFVAWMLEERDSPRTLEITDKQQEERRACPDTAAGALLMHLTRTNLLKDLREYGFYENTTREFSDVFIKETIDLAKKVRAILSKAPVVPEPLQLAGVNLDPATLSKYE